MRIKGSLGGKCLVCGAELYFANAIGVCKEHIHTEHCQCDQCLSNSKPKLRIRTRAELVRMGLLPEQRIF